MRLSTLRSTLKDQPDRLVDRLAMPLDAGILFPVASLKSYLLVRDIDFTLQCTGGWLHRQYVLIIRNVTARELLAFFEYLDPIADLEDA